MRDLFKSHTKAGKITLSAAGLGSLVALFVGLIGFFEVGVKEASADDVTTSVTVLNTAPTWTVNAVESVASTTTDPTNTGDTITFIGTATDSSNDDYYLIICKTGTEPTANSGAPPTCDGGIANQWAISAATAGSGPVQASAATSTIETFPFDQESNDWWAWVCDGAATLPKCNATPTGQGGADNESPFEINHPPVFYSISNDQPANPGESVTWTSGSYDNDTEGAQDNVQIFVCRADDFNIAVPGCGAAGAWATSTVVATNAATTTPISIPYLDDDYEAFVFVVDSHGHAATSTLQGSNSDFTVSNVAPSVTAASITLEDYAGYTAGGANINATGNPSPGGNLTLWVDGDAGAQATSGPYRLTFTVVDNNSCQNASAGDEIAATIANVYRSGVGQANCSIAGDYDANSCYVAASPLFHDISCQKRTDSGANSCSGSSDTDEEWYCTFSLWYIADPTDGSGGATEPQEHAQFWTASVQVTDDGQAGGGGGLSSSLTESTNGSPPDLESFLAFGVTQSSIGYSALEPGQSQDPNNIATSTDLLALGNVGLDEDLYGETMCVGWAEIGAVDFCDSDGIDVSEDITVDNQVFTASADTYGNGTSLTGSTTPTELELNVASTTSTSSPSSADTYWGILVPGTITQAGSYTGQNTITAIIGESANW